MEIEINNALEDLKEKVNECNSTLELEQQKTVFLGKKGIFNKFFQQLKNVDKTKIKEIGQLINTAKIQAETIITAKKDKLEEEIVNKEIADQWLDISLNKGDDNGALHPISLMQYEIEDIFSNMGFTIVDGPHIENDYYNFEALNIPKNHPARDMQDTFYFTNNAILRTHTSCMQVRSMEELKPPFKIIGPGKVFRVERSDPTHEACFHQLEGMVVDKEINVAQLINTMKNLLSEIFQKDIKVRLRPGYFPFVEPGFELDIGCQICQMKGCKTCKGVGWIELMPCGMVHPNVLEAGNIDSKKYSGFAFGLGLDRLIMMRHKIDDIRILHSGDKRFTEQFQ